MEMPNPSYKIIGILTAIILSIGLIIIMPAPWTYAATTLTVSNLNDSGTGSLRDAINKAENGDTIIFQNGLTGRIVLTEQLRFYRDLTIIGPGADKLIIDGNNKDRVFKVVNGKVNISGLTVANGKAIGLDGSDGESGTGGGGGGGGGGAEGGGGMLIIAGSVTLDGIVFTNNSTIGGTGGNGGTGGVASGTQQGKGGDGALSDLHYPPYSGRCGTVAEVQGKDNIHYGGAGGGFGGLSDGNGGYGGNGYNRGGNGGKGGNVDVEFFTQSGSKIAGYGGNGGQGGNGYGGAICITNGSLSVSNCTFTSNKAIGGTGGKAGSSDFTYPERSNYDFYGFGGPGGNALGGAIYIGEPVDDYKVGKVEIINCAFNGNEANGGKGGAAASGGTEPQNGNDGTGAFDDVGNYNVTDANLSTITASPPGVKASGSHYSTITVSLKNSKGNSLGSGKEVTLNQGSGSSVISPVSAVTNSNGQVTFTVSHNVAEAVTYTAQITTDNVTLSQSIEVNFNSYGWNVSNSQELADALGKFSSGDTIRLMNDIDYTSPISITGSNYNNRKQIIIDLNGHKLNVEPASVNSNDAVIKLYYVSMTLKGGGELNIIAHKGFKGLTVHESDLKLKEASKLNVFSQGNTQSGSRLNVVEVTMYYYNYRKTYSEAEITNVTVIGDNSCAVYAFGDSGISVKGNIICNGNNNIGAHSQYVSSVTIDGDVTVNGDGVQGLLTTGDWGTDGYPLLSFIFARGNVTVSGNDCIGITASFNGRIVVDGGYSSTGVYIKLAYYTGNIITKTFEEGVLLDDTYVFKGYLTYKFYDNEVYLKKPQGIEPVCKIDSTSYIDFGIALAAVESGKTIKLLNNTDYNSGIVIDNKHIIFDLNSKMLNITAPSGTALEVRGGGKVELSGSGDLNVACDDNIGSGYGVKVIGGSSATVNNVTVAGEDGFGVYADQGSNITVNGSISATGYIMIDGISKMSDDREPGFTKAGYYTYKGNTSTVLVKARVFTITTESSDNGICSASHDKASLGVLVTLSIVPDTGYKFKELQVSPSGLNIVDNSFNMPDEDVTVKAIFEPIIYTLKVGPLSYGKITVSHSEAKINDTIDLTIVPDTDFLLKAGSLKYNDGTGDHAISGTSFVMPAGNVTITAEFTRVDSVSVAPSNVTILKGNTQVFSAEVIGINSPDQAVIWSLSGSTNPNTILNSSGVLTVAWMKQPIP